ncbi:MAG TPA: hypothetical protein VMF89_29990 [Polyangiales bacterium]|nr:hypothetical protein [Polyangiales bacterium]
MRLADGVVMILASARVSLAALQRCRRGAVSAEYLMVAAVVGLRLAVTLVALGPEMVMGWAATRHVLYGRSP